MKHGERGGDNVDAWSLNRRVRIVCWIISNRRELLAMAGCTGTPVMSTSFDTALEAAGPGLLPVDASFTVVPL